MEKLSVHEKFFTMSDILTTVLLIYIGHFCEPADKNYQLKFSWKTSPTASEGMKIEVRHCDLNTTISACKPFTNLNCVFISYAPQKVSDLVANYNKNIVLLSKYRQK